jgi:hypothetical protein
MSLYSKQQFQFGLALESVRGTAEAAPVKWYPAIDPEVKFAPALLEDHGLRGVRAEYAPVAGRKLGSGKLKLILDPQVIGEFMYSLMGGVSSAESSVILIDSTNNKLDFNIGASQLTATIPSASYPIGLSQATTGSLCKAIYDAIVAAEAVGTYTVSYSRSTKKFTITRSAGTFVLMWNTGTNTATSIASTIGFSTAANSTGALTYTGGTSVEYAFAHTFSLGTGVQPPSYTFFLNYGLDVKVYKRAVVQAINFTGPVDNLIQVEVDFLFESEVASGSIGSPSFPTQRYLSFQHVTYKIAGSTNSDVKSWTLKLSNQAKHRLALAQVQTPQDIVAPDPFMVEGTLDIDFQSETERAKMLAVTSSPQRMLIEGSTIGNGVKYAVDLPVTDARYSEFPFGYENNLLSSKVNYKGYHDGTSIILPVVTNQVVAYA